MMRAAPSKASPARLAYPALPAPKDEAWIVVYNDLALANAIADADGRSFGAVPPGEAAILRLRPGPQQLAAYPAHAVSFDGPLVRSNHPPRAPQGTVQCACDTDGGLHILTPQGSVVTRGATPDAQARIDLPRAPDEPSAARAESPFRYTTCTVPTLQADLRPGCVYFARLVEQGPKATRQTRLAAERRMDASEWLEHVRIAAPRAATEKPDPVGAKVAVVGRGQADAMAPVWFDEAAICERPREP